MNKSVLLLPPFPPAAYAAGFHRTHTTKGVKGKGVRQYLRRQRRGQKGKRVDKWQKRISWVLVRCLVSGLTMKVLRSKTSFLSVSVSHESHQHWNIKI